MTILITDIAANDSGAFVVLKNCFDFVNKYGSKDDLYIFLVSTDKLSKELGSHVKVISYPQTKKSWWQRIRFELFKQPNLVKKLNPDVIFSLQNITVFFSRVPQVVYVHQPLPFVSPPFSWTNKLERFLAFYGLIFRVLIGISVRKAKKVIVQTQWMKRDIISMYELNQKKIVVIPPRLNLVYHASKELTSIKGLPLSENETIFLYPATPFIYKNFDVLVEAVRILVDQGSTIKVFLTISGTENEYSKSLVDKVRRYRLEGSIFPIGFLDREILISLMGRSILVFPSRLESFGLPLLEARTLGIRIVAADTSFSREILEGYELAWFFSPRDVNALSGAMAESMATNARVLPEKESGDTSDFDPYSDWKEIIKVVKKVI